MGKVIKCDFQRTERRKEMQLLSEVWNKYISGQVIISKDDQEAIQNRYSTLMFQENLWSTCKYYK